jgi:arabinose-5-phosphate isomerase
MLALGDALALTVCRRRNFTVDEFHKNHPGGLLGKQLMPIVTAMRARAGEGLAVVHEQLTVEQALETDSRRSGMRRAGALLIVDDAGRLTGIFTDSDLRRLLIRDGHAALSRRVRDVMTANPRRLTPQSLVRDAVQLVREYRIDELPVVDHDQKPLGLIDVQDLIALKVIEG